MLDLDCMAVSLQSWREDHDLTQVEAATLLGVSQPYLSLLEKGARPLTKVLRMRMSAVHRSCPEDVLNDRFREQLSALGYAPFGHVSPARVKPAPDVLLLSVLGQPDVDSRVVEALPWLVRTFVATMNFHWLVQQAKLGNLQNRMGFLFQASSCQETELLAAVEALNRALLLHEATLCWDSMPTATRKWMREHRSSLAKHWNLVTTLQPEQSVHVA